MTTERRTHTVARYPERRAHPFRSPWPTASRTRCEDCGLYYPDHQAPSRWACDTCPFTTADPVAREGHEHHAPARGWLGQGEVHRMRQAGAR